MKVKPLETASHENLPLSSLLFPAAKNIDTVKSSYGTF